MFLKQNQSDNKSSGRFENENLFEILKMKNMVIRNSTQHKQKIKLLCRSLLGVQKKK